jgi:hypothetical protein
MTMKTNPRPGEINRPKATKLYEESDKCQTLTTMGLQQDHGTHAPATVAHARNPPSGNISRAKSESPLESVASEARPDVSGAFISRLSSSSMSRVRERDVVVCTRAVKYQGGSASLCSQQ